MSQQNQSAALANPFAADGPVASPHVEQRTATSRRRFGIVPLCIGASRMVTMKDGRRQFEARELRVEAARAERDGRALNVGVVCFEIREEPSKRLRLFPSYEAFLAELPDTKTMSDNEEAYTWAYWCSDPADPNGPENVKALEAEVQGLTDLHRASIKTIPQCKSMDDMVKERKRAEELDAMAKDARAKLKKERDNIIGLLSETPFAA